MARRPVLIASNELFIALGSNSFANGGSYNCTVQQRSEDRSSTLALNSD
jgi:hypothetical protein